MRFIGLDPSTKTGFVALDEHGTVLKQKELTGVGSVDPKRMVTLINEVVSHLKPNDFICIEGFPFSTQKAMFAGGLHHGIRNELFKRNLTYYEAAPNAVKKFVGVTGWEGEKGSKKRLTGPQKKKAVMAAVANQFGFSHKSGNVVDAYILAEIARYIWTIESGVECSINSGYLSSNQDEVLQTILKTKGA
jgi:crossover junction endodeoxyribonuclease RuvC